MDMPCQRWNSGRHSWRHLREGGFDRRRYQVTELAEADAKAFCAAHHYAGASYPAALRRYGLIDRADGRLVGVAVIVGLGIWVGVHVGGENVAVGVAVGSCVAVQVNEGVRSCVAVAVKVSLSPEIARSFGTRHEYLYKPPQQKGSLPVATSFPAEFVITNVGLTGRLLLIAVAFLPSPYV